MPIPQVNDRIKEAPVVVLRAVFAGIGQILLTADKVRARAAEQAWTPDRAPAGLTADRRAPEPPGNGTTRTEPAAGHAAVREAPTSQAPVAPVGAPATKTPPAPKTTPTPETTPGTQTTPAAKTTPTAKTAPATKASRPVKAPSTAKSTSTAKAQPAAKTTQTAKAQPAAKTTRTAKAQPAAKTTRTAKAQPAAKTTRTAKTPPEKKAPGATKAAKAAPAPRAEKAEPPTEAPPLPGYDDLSVASLRARLRVLDAPAIQAMLAYEKAHAHREPVITMFERRLAKISAG